MKTVFCPKCHSETAQIVMTGEKTELRQNGKAVLTLSSKSKTNKLGIRCRYGHSVRVRIEGVVND